MSVAIIGTGNMATGLGHRIAATGRELAIGARDPAKAAQLAETLGPNVVGGGIEASAKLANIIFLAVPFSAAGAALKAAGPLEGKIIVDLTNPITPDYMALTIGHTTSAGEEVQKLAPGAHVVKAFNTIFAQILTAEEIGKVQVFYAGDDEAANKSVADLIEAMGFVPVYAGKLSNSRFLEPVAELNIHFGYALGHGTLTAPSWEKIAA